VLSIPSSHFSGDAGQRGGPSGDLYVFLSVEVDKRFRREGIDLYTDLSIDYLGACVLISCRHPCFACSTCLPFFGSISSLCWPFPEMTDNRLPFPFLSPSDAILGSEKPVPTADGKEEVVQIPSGTQPTTRITLKGKGVPRLGQVGTLLSFSSPSQP